VVWAFSITIYASDDILFKNKKTISFKNSEKICIRIKKIGKYTKKLLVIKHKKIKILKITEYNIFWKAFVFLSLFEISSFKKLNKLENDLYNWISTYGASPP
jgi:hypothetical protein